MTDIAGHDKETLRQPDGSKHNLSAEINSDFSGRYYARESDRGVNDSQRSSAEFSGEDSYSREEINHKDCHKKVINRNLPSTPRELDPADPQLQYSAQAHDPRGGPPLSSSTYSYTNRTNASSMEPRGQSRHRSTLHAPDSPSQEIRRLKNVINLHHEQLDNANLTIRWFQNENSMLIQAQQAQENQVRMAQKLLLKKSSKGKNTLAEEDNTIRDKFSALQTEIRDWSKTWAIGEIAPLESNDPSQRRGIMNYLARVVRIDNETLPASWNTSRMRVKAPSMCLSALLSNEIYESVFGKPFLPYQVTISDPPGTEEAGRIPLGINTVQGLYERLSDYDEIGAQAWRRHTLELLDPINTDAGGPSSQAVKDAMNQRKTTAICLTDAFLDNQKPCFALFKHLSTDSEAAERRQELLEIFHQALQMSAQLWKQPAILKCLTLAFLDEQKFRADSEFMDAHPLHGLYDGDETRLDDHRILMVISPVILAMGNSDRENYMQYRVWAKAIVWLEE